MTVSAQSEVEAVYIGVEHPERICVEESSEEFALTLCNGAVAESGGQPRRGIRVEVPADGVGAVTLQSCAPATQFERPSITMLLPSAL